jgi:hypothetical protein
LWISKLGLSSLEVGSDTAVFSIDTVLCGCAERALLPENFKLQCSASDLHALTWCWAAIRGTGFPQHEFASSNNCRSASTAGCNISDSFISQPRGRRWRLGSRFQARCASDKKRSMIQYHHTAEGMLLLTKSPPTPYGSSTIMII